MSSRAENWAWERDDVKGITKFVLVYLARRAYYDDGAAAWPSVETIAFNCGCCERTVIRSLQELERKGYIRPGDQEMSARNPRTRKPIAKGHRSRVWDVVMDGGHPAENIEEKPRNLDALAEGDGKPDPMKDNLSPDGLSPEPKDVEPRTNCPGILDRKSPNRQVINNSPLIPFGDAPLNAEQAATKPVADPKPEPVPATMADRKAVHSLPIDRPYGEIVATMDWACRSTGRRCCAPRCVRNTSKASSRRRRARYAHTTNATTPPTASPDGARRKPARRRRRCGHERGRAAS